MLSRRFELRARRSLAARRGVLASPVCALLWAPRSTLRTHREARTLGAGIDSVRKIASAEARPFTIKHAAVTAVCFRNPTKFVSARFGQ